MTISTLFRYLFGSREAILQVASCKQAVWLGLLLVLSAGFAREYDGEDLLREPWHLLLPLAASTVTASLLFVLIVGGLNMRNEKNVPFLSLYRPFLSLYWMTAPLAWFYAIPVERFLSAGDATLANLRLLGLVSVWRVCLMTRAISVLMNLRFRDALMPVMLFADTLALFLIMMTPLPMFSIMGGIRLSDSERIIQQTTFTVVALGIFTWPIWIIGTMCVLGNYGQSWEPTDLETRSRGRVSPLLWALAACAIVGWLPILPATQAEQQLRSQVESDLKQGRISQALALMSAHQPDDFPPHWDPPPRVGYNERLPPLIDVMEAIIAEPPAPWVRYVFLDKFRNQLGREYHSSAFWSSLDRQQLDRYLTVLEELPEGLQIVSEQRYGLEHLFEVTRYGSTDFSRQRIQALLKSIGHVLAEEESHDEKDQEPQSEEMEMKAAMAQPAAPAESKWEH